MVLFIKQQGKKKGGKKKKSDKKGKKGADNAEADEDAGLTREQVNEALVCVGSACFGVPCVGSACFGVARSVDTQHAHTRQTHK